MPARAKQQSSTPESSHVPLLCVLLAGRPTVCCLGSSALSLASGALPTAGSHSHITKGTMHPLEYCSTEGTERWVKPESNHGERSGRMPAPESVSPSPKRHAAIPSVQGEDRQTPPTKPQHHAHHHPPQSHRRVPLLLVPQARRLGLWGFPPGPLILSQPRSHRGQRIPSQEARSGNVGATRKATLSLPCPAPPSPSPLPTASCGIWDSRALTRANTTSPKRWCLESRQADTQAKNSAEASPRAPGLPSQREHPTPNARPSRGLHGLLPNLCLYQWACCRRRRRRCSRRHHGVVNACEIAESPTKVVLA